MYHGKRSFCRKTDKDTESQFEGNSIILQYNNSGILVETMITKV